MKTRKGGKRGKTRKTGKTGKTGKIRKMYGGGLYDEIIHIENQLVSTELTIPQKNALKQTLKMLYKNLEKKYPLNFKNRLLHPTKKRLELAKKSNNINRINEEHAKTIKEIAAKREENAAKRKENERAKEMEIRNRKREEEKQKEEKRKKEEKQKEEKHTSKLMSVYNTLIDTNEYNIFKDMPFNDFISKLTPEQKKDLYDTQDEPTNAMNFYLDYLLGKYKYVRGLQKTDTSRHDTYSSYYADD
jgi:hypothetical protein